MLTFREFLLEEIDTQATTDGGDASFLNPEALQNINSNLAAIGRMKFISPYQGLIKIRKALATYNIFFGDYVFDLEDEDEAVFAIQQFGEKTVEADDGTVSNDMTVKYLYIMMTRLEDGTFEVDSEIVDEDQLDDILDDDADLEEIPDERYYNDVHEEEINEGMQSIDKEISDTKDWHERELKQPHRVHKQKMLADYHKTLSHYKSKGFTHVDSKIGQVAGSKGPGLLVGNHATHQSKNLVHPFHKDEWKNSHADEERLRKEMKKKKNVHEGLGGEDLKIEIDKAIRRAKGDLNDAKDDANRSADKKWGSSLIKKHQDHLSKLVNHKKSGVTHVNHRTGDPIHEAKDIDEIAKLKA